MRTAIPIGGRFGLDLLDLSTVERACPVATTSAGIGVPAPDATGLPTLRADLAKVAAALGVGR